MKNLKLILMAVAGLSAGLVATDSSTNVEKDTGNSWCTFTSFQEALFDNSFQGKFEDFKKTLSDEQLSRVNSLPESNRNKAIRGLYFQANPSTNVQTIAGVTLLSATVGGFMAYNYLYPSMDKDSKKDECFNNQDDFTSFDA